MDIKEHIDELSKEIYARNGVAVPREDPIMIQETINQRWVIFSAAVHQKQMDMFKSEMEAFADRWLDDNKILSKKMLNASLDASKAAMKDILNEGGKEVVEALREVHKEANKEATERINTTIKNLNTLSMMNLVAALLTITAAGLIVWLVKFH